MASQSFSQAVDAFQQKLKKLEVDAIAHIAKENPDETQKYASYFFHELEQQKISLQNAYNAEINSTDQEKESEKVNRPKLEASFIKIEKLKKQIAKIISRPIFNPQFSA